MELDQAVSPLGTGRQESSAEMQGALLLAETGAGDGAHAGGVEHAEAVELVGGAALLLGLLERLGRERDGGEEVHGALEESAVGR
jgi:hypothetical protein